MNPKLVLSLLKSPLTWLAIVGLALVAQTARVQVATSKLKAAEFQLVAQETQTDAAVAANRSCTDTVKDLERRLQKLVDERAIEASVRDTVLRESERAREAALQAAADERRKRDALWRSTQSCAGLASLRVSAACADVADRVRERTARRDPDADS